MADPERAERAGVVIVGAGAAGLAVAAALRDHDPLILDRAERVGDSWRRRYAGLRLFTPARYCALPGRPLPLDPDAYPGKDEYADYLEEYGTALPARLRMGTDVLGHRYHDGRHLLVTSGGLIAADRLVWAGGAHTRPVLPPFTGDLDRQVHQRHSAALGDLAELPPGPVLVVGAGQSGADIALAASAGHRTYLAGRHTGTLPLPVARSRSLRAVYGLPAPGGPIRRFLLSRGSPLIRTTARHLVEAGVLRVPRVIGARDGLPRLADDRVLPVSTVIWCTGLRPDLGWLDPHAAAPEHRRGVSTALPGLTYVGLRLQRTLNSGFLAGMPGDAAYVARHLNPTVPNRFDESTRRP